MLIMLFEILFPVKLLIHRYDSQGASSTFQAFTSAGGSGGAGAGGNMRPDQFRLIGEAKDALLGSGEQPDFFCVRAQLVFIKKDNMSYPACSTCNKKMSMEDTDVWRCEKCDRTYPAPEYRSVSSIRCFPYTPYNSSTTPLKY